MTDTRDSESLSSGASSDGTPASGPKPAIRPSWWQIVQAHPAMKAVRVTTFVAATASVAVIGAYSHARSQLGEQLLSVGSNMMRYEGANTQDEPREMRINGQSLMMRSGTTDDSVDAVLDRFEAQCSTGQQELRERVDFMTQQAGITRSLFVLREMGGPEGVVACLDFGQEELSVADLAERAARFRASNDLHDLGDLRFVFAEPMNDGSGAHFLTFWTNGSLDFDEVTGRGGNGDVPGADIDGIPRPPRSRRVLDASETGHPDRVLMYFGSSMTGWELESFYRRELTHSGYHVIDPGERGTREISTRIRGTVLGGERDGHLTFVVLDTDERGLGRATIITGE